MVVGEVLVTAGQMPEGGLLLGVVGEEVGEEVGEAVGEVMEVSLQSSRRSWSGTLASRLSSSLVGTGSASRSFFVNLFTPHRRRTVLQ